MNFVIFSSKNFASVVEILTQNFAEWLIMNLDVSSCSNNWVITNYCCPAGTVGRIIEVDISHPLKKMLLGWACWATPGRFRGRCKLQASDKRLREIWCPTGGQADTLARTWHNVKLYFSDGAFLNKNVLLPYQRVCSNEVMTIIYPHLKMNISMNVINFNNIILYRTCDLFDFQLWNYSYKSS